MGYAPVQRSNYATWKLMGKYVNCWKLMRTTCNCMISTGKLIKVPVSLINGRNGSSHMAAGYVTECLISPTNNGVASETIFVDL